MPRAIQELEPAGVATRLHRTRHRRGQATSAWVRRRGREGPSGSGDDEARPSSASGPHPAVHICEPTSGRHRKRPRNRARQADEVARWGCSWKARTRHRPARVAGGSRSTAIGPTRRSGRSRAYTPALRPLTPSPAYPPRRRGFVFHSTLRGEEGCGGSWRVGRAVVQPEAPDRRGQLQHSASSNGRPTTWKPSGSPAAVKPPDGSRATPKTLTVASSVRNGSTRVD